MRRAVPVPVVIVLFWLLAGPLAAEEQSAYEVEGWKRRVASPTYGLAIGFLEVSNSEGSLDPIPVPGIELRIFNGMNVAKRGGFFTGYEVGTIFFFLPESDPIAVDTSTPTEGTIKGLGAGTVFLLSKYGYRLDLGLKAAGLSGGVELGIGAQMSMGGFDIEDVNSSADEYIEVQSFSMMLDAALEGAFRMGQNFRFFLRAGASVIPPLFDWSSSYVFGDDNDDAGNPIYGGGGYMSVMMVPIILNARLGFALNY